MVVSGMITMIKKMHTFVTCTVFSPTFTPFTRCEVVSEHVAMGIDIYDVPILNLYSWYIATC